MDLLALIGFILAAYAVVANDVIQTLGTFISSKKNTKTIYLFLFIGGILVLVLTYGWFQNNGDVSYSRLDKIPQPEIFHWWYLLPPLILMGLTRLGIPVSTTFLMLSIFSSQIIIEKIVLKSVLGYAVAAGFACLVYVLIFKWSKTYWTKPKPASLKWEIVQWTTTGCLWAVWMMQDLANIYVFLPRQLDPLTLLLTLLVLLLFLAYILSVRGGKIQAIVNSKTGTSDVRAASLIDGIYALVLFFFKELNNLPMSTTWVFVGLLAGREIGINLIQRSKSNRATSKMLLQDFLKILLGLVISLLTAYVFKFLDAA